MKIMIVDDNKLMREAIIQAVSRDNDEIIEFENGEGAVDNCEQFQPDWILMDIQMSKMNGIVAAEKIIEKLPRAKIAFVTSYDNKVYRTKAEKIGAKHYFIKNNLIAIRSEIEFS